MKYVGKLQSGKIFDQTKGNATFQFRLGVGEVIKGWDVGVEGMRVGDKRRQGGQLGLSVVVYLYSSFRLNGSYSGST